MEKPVFSDEAYRMAAIASQIRARGSQAVDGTTAVIWAFDIVNECEHRLEFEKSRRE